MARRGGFPGGMPGMNGMNMNNLMKQYQKMQRQMEETQEALQEKEYTATAGGAVTVTVSGAKRLTSIKIDPDALDPEDAETLEDMIMAAVNQALTDMEEDAQNSMGKLTGGMNLGF